MNVLVVDAGSGSLHLRVVADDGAVHAGQDLEDPSSQDTVQALRELAGGDVPIDAVGHRIVHGGPDLRAPRLVDEEVRARLDLVAKLAPLHVPPALAALDEARRVLADVPHVACFDTAFHAGLPEAAYVYALPAEWRERYGIRRYGFHGLSYEWTLARSAELLGRPADRLQVVLTHLGGGCSATAVRAGRSVDTTMGFTPLEGMVMSRRSGTVDPGLLLWLATEHGLTAEEMTEALNRRSGLTGLSGTSGDTRELVKSRASGDAAAALALAVFTHRARRAIAAMAASLDRVDALVFTGEIGEDQPEVREEICAGLGVLGICGGLGSAGVLSEDTVVSAPGAAVPVLVVPTGEIQQIVIEVRSVLPD
ncbi:MAG: acetate kinase [Streptosporangiaceae bacterium]|jgi:acetate kinase|nr:acetate/propionate family kinase [Streptosporangiaceae bacterium]MDX6429410.1 acetate kinase [Streptosporangiaceae bacterium]